MSLRGKFSFKPSPSLLRKIYNWTIEHWFWSAIIPLSSYLFLLISIYGTDFGFRNKDGELNSWVLLISLVIFVISATFSFLKGSADRWNEHSKYTGQKVLGYVNQSLNALKEFKYRRFKKYINDFSTAEHQNPFPEITQPKLQIELILDNIRTVLADTFGLERDLIGVSVLMKLDKKVWDWITTINIREGIEIDELVNNEKTTAYQIINRKQHHIFFPDKREGIKKNQYVSDAMDNSYDNNGSIFCTDISINQNKVQGVLSITSYKLQFCKVNDKEAQDLLINQIFTTFEKRIKVELALLYIKEVMCKKDFNYLENNK